MKIQRPQMEKRPLTQLKSVRLFVFVLAAVLLAQIPGDTLARKRGRRTKQKDRTREKARALISSGDMSYRLFHFQKALQHYKEAYKLTGHPAIIFNIAQAYRQLKNNEKAHFYYKLFLTDWSRKHKDKPPPFAEEVRGHIERLSRLLEAERRGRQPQTARITLEGIRPGARIYLDGRLHPGPRIAAPPGRHALRVELDGYRTWEEAVDLMAGKLHVRQVTLRPPDHRTLLLVTSITATAVAVGFLGVGAHYNTRHNDYISETPEADDTRRLSVMGYAVAGGSAAVAAASWTLYLLHRRKVLRLLSAAPLPGGGALTARGRF